MSEQKYEGKWKIPNTEELQEGILFVNLEKGFLRLKLFVMYEAGFGLAEGIKTICSIIQGNLIGNNKITLVDNTVISRHEYLGSYTEVVFDVKWAVWGVHYQSEDEIRYKKYSVDMDGILNWSGLCHFRMEDFKNYKWDKEENVQLKMSENLKTTFIPMCKGGKRTSLIEKNLQLEQYIKIDFEYDNETCLTDFIKDYKKMEMLISIGVGTIPLIRKMYFCDRENTTFTNYEPREIYTGDKPYSDGYEEYGFKMLFRLNDLTCGEAIKRWNEIIYKMEPVINLYFSILRYHDFPIEMQYLNIVQALETYHARFKYNNLKKYREHVLSIFNCKTIDDIEENHREAYYGTTQSDKNISYIILKSRIVDLMNDDFKFRLSPLYTKGMIISLYDFIEKVADTRHYYTHYGENKEEKAFKELDLQYAIAVLMEVFEYHFLTELGLGNAGTVDTIYRKHERLNCWYIQRCEIL